MALMLDTALDRLTTRRLAFLLVPIGTSAKAHAGPAGPGPKPPASRLCAESPEERPISPSTTRRCRPDPAHPQVRAEHSTRYPSCSRRRRDSGSVIGSSPARGTRKASRSRSRGPGIRRSESAMPSNTPPGAPSRAWSPCRPACADRLEVPDRSPECGALLGIRERAVECELGAGDRCGGADQPLSLQLPHDVVEALADLAEHRGLGHAHILEGGQRCVRRASPSFRAFSTRTTPGRCHRYEEQRRDRCAARRRDRSS